MTWCKTTKHNWELPSGLHEGGRLFLVQHEPVRGHVKEGSETVSDQYGLFLPQPSFFGPWLGKRDPGHRQVPVIADPPGLGVTGSSLGTVAGSCILFPSSAGEWSPMRVRGRYENGLVSRQGRGGHRGENMAKARGVMLPLSPFIVSFNFSLSSFPLFTTFFSSLSLFHSRFKKIFPPPISSSFLSPLAPNFLINISHIYQWFIYLSSSYQYLSICESIIYLPINNYQLSLTCQSSAIYNLSIIYQSPVIHQSSIYHLLINIYQIPVTYQFIYQLSIKNNLFIIYLSAIHQSSINYQSSISYLLSKYHFSLISFSVSFSLAFGPDLSLSLSLPPFLLYTCLA